MRNFKLKLGLTVLINASLLGCGGGGSGSNDSVAASVGSAGNSGATYSAITRANYETVASTVLDPLGELTSLNSATGLIASGVEVNEANANAAASSLASVSTRIYKRFTRTTGQFVTGATYTEACSRGGSVTVSESAASDDRVTAGDRATLTANNCAEDDLPALNGTLSIVIDSVSGDPVNTNRYSLGLTATFGNLLMNNGDRRVQIDGALKILASQNGSSDISVGLSGQRLGLSVTQSGMATNAYSLADFNLTGTESGSTTSLSGSYTLSGTSARLGAYVYRVETVRPVVTSGFGSFVSAGAMRITGSPAMVTVTALDGTSLLVEYSANGDGVVSASSTLTRSQFDALN
ncbi:hypothetical protein [Noviherbaspirillum suwonense]|uniref:Lipoprotein n=1 Tax=Noviherbaspirillum suwonense TaxID=1224511 RepID=A0ABY1PTT0_9BURK|nr:hypothetical protein [Noviherbaspirillum suwonense]SMP45767.1 hypothetical protein SAMN06295970_101563 [Noviherbaspirillum suwonense]